MHKVHSQSFTKKKPKPKKNEYSPFYPKMSLVCRICQTVQLQQKLFKVKYKVKQPLKYSLLNKPIYICIVFVN